MKKIFILLILALFLFVVLAIVQALPEPVQTKMNDFAGKLFPAKDQLEDKQEKYTKAAEEASQ